MIFDKFKKIISSGEKAAVKSAKTTKSIKPSQKKSKIAYPSYGVIKEPLVTEKGGLLQAGNKYVFKVSSAANKIEVKKAVGVLYNVKVKEVNILNTPDKKRQRGAATGYKIGFKKAIVTLEEGNKIEFI